VVRPDVAAAVVEMMERVVAPGGTAKGAALRGVHVAGKTGTAQKLDRETGTYADDRFVAWFIGIVPADDPKLVIVAGIDEPQRPRHTGGAAAAPLFAHMAASQLARFGIVTEPGVAVPAFAPDPADEIAVAVAPEARRREAPQEAEIRLAALPPVATAPTPAPIVHAVAPAAAATMKTAAVAPPPKAKVRPKATPVERRRRADATTVAAQLAPLGDRILLPDFRGLTRSEVSRITAQSVLDVKMTGRGRAVTQDPPAGTIVGAAQALVFIHFEDVGSSGQAGEG
jgi:membrane peptidoglycan carboxypeptidase